MLLKLLDDDDDDEISARCQEEVKKGEGPPKGREEYGVRLVTLLGARKLEGKNPELWIQPIN